MHNLLPFYRDQMGFPVSFESPGFVVLGQPGSVTLLVGTHSDVHGRARKPARHIIGFDTNDITSDAARLKAAGVRFVEEPNKQEGLWLATFEDPDGNLVRLLQFEPEP